MNSISNFSTDPRYYNIAPFVLNMDILTLASSIESLQSFSCSLYRCAPASSILGSEIRKSGYDIEFCVKDLEHSAIWIHKTLLKPLAEFLEMEPTSPHLVTLLLENSVEIVKARHWINDGITDQTVVNNIWRDLQHFRRVLDKVRQRQNFLWRSSSESIFEKSILDNVDKILMFEIRLLSAEHESASNAVNSSSSI